MTAAQRQKGFIAFLVFSSVVLLAIGYGLDGWRVFHNGPNRLEVGLANFLRVSAKSKERIGLDCQTLCWNASGKAECAEVSSEEEIDSFLSDKVESGTFKAQLRETITEAMEECKRYRDAGIVQLVLGSFGLVSLFISVVVILVSMVGDSWKIECLGVLLCLAGSFLTTLGLFVWGVITHRLMRGSQTGVGSGGWLGISGVIIAWLSTFFYWRIMRRKTV